jgi:hypothetical protein
MAFDPFSAPRQNLDGVETRARSHDLTRSFRVRLGRRGRYICQHGEEGRCEATIFLA